MIQSLIFLRIDLQAPTTYTVPLLEKLRQQLPGLTIFEFDNFSEARIREYGADLAKQSSRLAIVVEVAAATAPISGLTTFFNRLLRLRPESLLLVLQGEQPTLEKMMKGLAKNATGPDFCQNLSETALGDLLKQFFN